MTGRRIALAYSGSLAGSAAIGWLSEAGRAEVAAVIVDVGQADDPAELHDRALSCGAVRAHVFDRRDVFARTAVLPAVAATAPLDAASLRRLPYPVVAAALVEAAGIERTTTVAWVAEHSLDPHVHHLAPALDIVVTAQQWRACAVNAADYAHLRRLPQATRRPERHLLIRPLPARRAEGGDVRIMLGFERGEPTSLNGVAMGLCELIECLSLIAGHGGLGSDSPTPAPAAAVLRAAYAAGGGCRPVTLRLSSGALTADCSDALHPELVHHP